MSQSSPILPDDQVGREDNLDEVPIHGFELCMGLILTAVGLALFLFTPTMVIGLVVLPTGVALAFHACRARRPKAPLQYPITHDQPPDQ